jgi:hypothetical protein
MSAGRRARGGVAFRVGCPPNPPRAASPAIAIALSCAIGFLAVFGGLHLIGRFL